MLTPEAFKSLVQRAHSEFPLAGTGEPAKPLAFCAREALKTAWRAARGQIPEVLLRKPQLPRRVGSRYDLDGSVDGEERAGAVAQLEALKQRREVKQAA